MPPAQECASVYILEQGCLIFNGHLLRLFVKELILCNRHGWRWFQHYDVLSFAQNSKSTTVHGCTVVDGLQKPNPCIFCLMYSQPFPSHYDYTPFCVKNPV